MSKTDQHPSGTSLNASTRKWADEVVAIEENPKQGGLEIRFNAEPSPQLRPKLRVKGFRPSSSKTMWYGDQTEQALEFARQVKDSLPTSPEGPDLFISPSLDAVRSNIEKKEYSFILITLKSGQVKNFIVFEPSKPRAEVIALNFARQEFKDEFLAFAVQPKTHIREARVLFDEGKIIGAGEDVPGQMNVHKESKTLQPETVKQPGKISVKEILLTTTEDDGQPLYKEGKAFSAWSGADLFVKGLAGKFPKVYYRIIWQNGGTADGKIELEPMDFYQGKEDILSSHVQSYFFNLSMAKPNAHNSKEAIEKATKILEEYELKHNRTITQPTPEKKTEKIDAFTLIKNFHEWLKDDSGYAKVEHASYVDFINWLKESNTELSEEDKERVWNHHLALLKAVNKLHGVSQTQPYSSIYNKLNKVIPDLIEHIRQGKYHGKSAKDPFGGLMDLHYDYVGKDKNGNYIIALSHYFKQNGDMVADPDMQIRIFPELRLAEAMTYQDQFGYKEVYPDKSDGKEYVDLRLKKSLNTFLNQWLRNLIDQHHRIDLSKENAGQKEESVSNSQQATTTDLKSGDTFLPNVLVPAGTQEPFLSQNFSIHDMPAIIKENFPHLLKINEENLAKASALEIFELVQMAHPTEYGIDVGRWAMLSEWEKRGKQMFEQLGYPTDVIYPYVNLYLGYESIQALGEILSDNNKEGNEWWVVAEHYRPIADPKKGLEIINQLIEKQKRERQTLINPKTGKPKLEFKHLHRDIELTIENLEDSKDILNFYLEHSTEKSNSTVETEPDPLTNENGVFTEKTAEGNLLEIEIPMPKAAQYRANISIAKTSKGDYRYGLRAEKQFGDREGMSYAPNISGQSYPSEKQALESGLKEHDQRLELLLKAKDSLLNNQGKKSTMLSAALSALRKFAEGEGIFLEKIEPVKKNIQFLHVSPERAKPLEEKKSDDEKTNSNAGIIKGLEEAYWRKADNEYPVDKVIIQKMKFHQARLRKALEGKLVKLPLTTLQNIADELSRKFKERRPWNTYEKGYVTIGKTGDKRKEAAIAIYVDDLIIDNDLMGEMSSPVMTFLMELLFAGDQKLVDFPITKNMEENKKGSPILKEENIKRSLAVIEKRQSQYELNGEIEALIDKKDKEKTAFDEEEKNYIRQYTGSGGLIKEGAQGRGVLYEYYTPDEVVKKMWGLARKYGYSGGRVLEPSVGTGNFLKYAPKEADVFGFETNHYSVRIAQVLYPQARIFEKSFETIFFAGNIHLKNDFDHAPYDLVIGNPPYGDFTGKYAGMGEKQWTGATEYDQYFITRGLDLLSPGGLLVFIVPSSFLSYSEKSKKVKQKIAEKADLLDAYRLPIRTFETTDIGTDIVVFKKK